MSSPLAGLAALLQVSVTSDTVVARVVQDRGIWDHINGVLEILVLVLVVVLLGVLITLLLTLRKVLVKGQATVDKLVGDVRPIIQHAEHIAGDARAAVSQLRSDVERVTNAAGAVSDQLLDAAAVTAQRVDEVNAVLDVVQQELEDVAISSVATVRGVRTGASELASALSGRRSGKVRKQRDGALPPRAVREDLEERRLHRGRLRGGHSE